MTNSKVQEYRLHLDDMGIQSLYHHTKEHEFCFMFYKRGSLYKININATTVSEAKTKALLHVLGEHVERLNEVIRELEMEEKYIRELREALEEI